MKVKKVDGKRMKPWKSHVWLHANKDKWNDLKEGKSVEVPKEVVEFLGSIVGKSGPEPHPVRAGGGDKGSAG